MTIDMSCPKCGAENYESIDYEENYDLNDNQSITLVWLMQCNKCHKTWRHTRFYVLDSYDNELEDDSNEEL